MFILLSILIFGLIIAIHEFGHYIAAKAFGVGVPEFAIGMGPKLLKKQGKETLYSLRAIPIGGFCALDGDDNKVQGGKSLFTKPLWKRIVIFLAGSTMNIIAGFLLFLIVAGNMSTLPTTTFAGFNEDVPLEDRQGLLPGDRFYRIDGLRVYQVSNVLMFLDIHAGDTVDVIVIRDDRQVLLNDFPIQRELPRFGFQFDRIESPTFADRFGYALNDTRDFMRQFPLTIRMFASGQAGMQDISSVVGIVDVMNQAGATAENARVAAMRMVMLTAVISISVAVINLLPIPGLDGGRIFLMLITTGIEKVTRRKVNPQIESYINTAGLLLLFSFMIYMIFQDIVQIASR